MSPPAGPRRHHCSFKMPHNPLYDCPRAGIMYQASGNAYYCSFHDKYAQDRCQAFFDFHGSGIQCPELHTMVDPDTGKKFCDKHEPSSEIPEVADWTTRMTEWLTNVAIAEPPRVDKKDLSESSASEAKSGVLEPEKKREPSLQPEQELERKPESKSKHDIQDREATPSTHEPTTGEISPTQGEGDTPALKAVQKPEPESGPELQPEHIAALYLQCNICLENHNTADMNKIEGCGHQYKESCLQDFLRRKGVRKYNCTGCWSWLQSHQER
jgi:hypothetical protein